MEVGLLVLGEMLYGDGKWSPLKQKTYRKPKWSEIMTET